MSVCRFKPLCNDQPRTQRIADLDRLMLWNYWLIDDGEHPAVDSKKVRAKIDSLLDARLYLMSLK